jgi:predicted nucleic acid-binding protein
VTIADCLIAAVAVNNDLDLLAADRGFETIALHTGLRLAA